jgi:hypothetical protein
VRRSRQSTEFLRHRARLRGDASFSHRRRHRKARFAQVTLFLSRTRRTSPRLRLLPSRDPVVLRGKPIELFVLDVVGPRRLEADDLSVIYKGRRRLFSRRGTSFRVADGIRTRDIQIHNLAP